MSPEPGDWCGVETPGTTQLHGFGRQGRGRGDGADSSGGGRAGREGRGGEGQAAGAATSATGVSQSPACQPGGCWGRQGRAEQVKAGRGRVRSEDLCPGGVMEDGVRHKRPMGTHGSMAHGLHSGIAGLGGPQVWRHVWRAATVLCCMQRKRRRGASAYPVGDQGGQGGGLNAAAQEAHGCHQPCALQGYVVWAEAPGYAAGMSG